MKKSGMGGIASSIMALFSRMQERKIGLNGERGGEFCLKPSVIRSSLLSNVLSCDLMIL